MKRLIILNFILLLFSASSFGQKKILSENNVWKELYWYNGYSGFSCVDQHTLRIGDVVQKNGFSYYEILDNISGESEITGFIREENNKYYFLLKDLTEEYLLYDFNLQEGETVSVISTVVDEREFLESLFEDRKQDFKDGKCVHTVTKVEQIADLQGNLRKHITLDDNVVWIEGIGSTRGLLHSYDSYMFGSYLSSFTENEAVVYQRNFCPRKTSLMETNLESYISPNPVKDILTLTLSTDNNEIRIFDLQGKLLLQQNVGFSTEVNVSMLPKGTYVLMVNNLERRTFIKQ